MNSAGKSPQSIGSLLPGIGTFPEKPQERLQDALIIKLFEQLRALYPTLWESRLEAAGGLEISKRAWSAMLAGLTPQSLAVGLHALKGREYPPGAPEFAELCRIRRNPDEAYAAASAGRHRDDAVIFHAVQMVGGIGEVQSTPRHTMLPRFTAALRRFEDEEFAGRLAPIPSATPAPQITYDREFIQPDSLRAKARDALARAQQHKIHATRQWAADHLHQVATGGQGSQTTVSMALTALRRYL